MLNDRSVDTGDLAPGASSQPMAIAAAGGQYHCSIHPAMVGSVNQDTSTTPAPVRARTATEGPFNHFGADAPNSASRPTTEDAYQ